MAETQNLSHTSQKREIGAYVKLVLKGLAMGAADIVPGVSGGTMALILGVYEELIESLRNLGQANFLRKLAKFRLGQAFATLNGSFLIALGSGILLALLLLSRSLEALLQSYPVLIWSFFFGLIAASVITVSRRITQWQAVTIATFLASSLGAYLLVGLVPAQTPQALWFLFFSGALAITAMILPGISGAFILVLIGKYEFMLAAINNRDLLSIAVFALGALIGLISFAQVLGWLFKRYHNVTIALLSGFMLGSLRKIWPWKSSVGEQIEVNVLPLLSFQGEFNTEIIYAILLAILGFALVLGLEQRGHTKRKH